MKPKIDVVEYLPTHSTKEYRTRDLGRINDIVIHHSATKWGDPWAFASYHVNVKGYPGIAYQTVIMPNGIRFKTNYDSTVSWHTENFNSTSIGICVVGNFDEDVPTNEQKLSLFEELMLYGQSYLIPGTHVWGHREKADSSCPGDNVSMEDVRGMHRLIMLR